MDELEKSRMEALHENTITKNLKSRVEGTNGETSQFHLEQQLSILQENFHI